MKNFFLSLLSSNITLFILLVGWVVNLLFSFLMFPPGNDLGEYFIGSLGIRYYMENGMYYGDEFSRKYYIQPGFTFFQGIFLYFASFLKIPSSFYSFRLFHFTALGLLIPSSGYLIYLMHEKKKTDWVTHFNIFLLLLAASPFVLYCWGTRPEVLSILFVITGITLYCIWRTEPLRRNWKLYLSGFLAGVPITLHLNFVIVVAALILAIALADYKKFSFLQAIIFSFWVALPACFVAIWFAAHTPESFAELGFVLSNKKNSGMYGAGLLHLVEEALMLGKWDSIFIKIYHAIFTFPLLFLLLVSIPVLWRKNLAMLQRDRFALLPLSLFLVSIGILVIDTKGLLYYAILLSFFAAFFIPFLVTFEKNRPLRECRLSSLQLLSLFPLLFVVLMHSLVHASKFSFAKDKYYYSPAVYATVTGKLTPGDNLFLTSGSYLGTFFENFDKQYRDTSVVQTYHIFPQTYLENKSAGMYQFLLAKLNSVPHEKIVWGLNKNRITFDRSGSEISAMIYITRRPPVKLNLNVQEVIYEDKNTIFVRSQAVKIVD